MPDQKDMAFSTDLPSPATEHPPIQYHPWEDLGTPSRLALLYFQGTEV